MKLLKIATLIICFSLGLSSCQLAKLGGDAKENPPDPRLRVQKNLEEGKGFRLMDFGDNKGGGTFEFASSNELWRASLDTIDFIPLAAWSLSNLLMLPDKILSPNFFLACNRKVISVFF